jgi:hypothetical protein
MADASNNEVLAVVIEFRDAVAQKLDAIDRRFDTVDETLARHGRKLELHDRRFDALEGWLQRIDERVAKLEFAS